LNSKINYKNLAVFINFFTSTLKTPPKSLHVLEFLICKFFGPNFIGHKHAKVNKLVILAQKVTWKIDFSFLNFKPFTNVINFGMY
jgi:hypothetical protein